MENFKFRCIEYLLSAYKNITWTNTNDKELTANFAGYTILFGIRREGIYLSFTVNDSNKCEIIDESEFPQIRSLYNSIWEYVSEREQNLFWSTVYANLLK